MKNPEQRKRKRDRLIIATMIMIVGGVMVVSTALKRWFG